MQQSIADLFNIPQFNNMQNKPSVYINKEEKESVKLSRDNFINFTFIDLFAGIGGFRIPISNLGGDCLGFSEIDNHAIKTYISNYCEDPKNNFGNITKIKILPHVDLLVGGVPCQSWSVAGKMKGFDDDRGLLWNDVIRLVESSQPKVFVFENVKGLLSEKNEESFNYIINSFKQKNYLVKVNMLNSYDFDVPQLRERVFIVGFRADLRQQFNHFRFPAGKAVHRNLSDYLDDVERKDVNKGKLSVSELFGNTVPSSRNIFQKEDELNDFFTMCDTRNGHSTIHSWDLADTTPLQKDIMNVVLTNRRKKIYGPKDGNPLSFEDISGVMPNIKLEDLEGLVEAGLLRRVDNKFELKNSKNSSGINNLYRMYMPYSKIFSTLTATGTKDVVVTDYIDTDVTPDEYKRQFIEKIIKNKRYRALTVQEVQRIQGFPGTFIPHEDEKIAKKQFGNAVSPPVIEALIKKIIETKVFDLGATLNEQHIRLYINLTKSLQKSSF